MITPIVICNQFIRLWILVNVHVRKNKLVVASEALVIPSNIIKEMFVIQIYYALHQEPGAF